MAGNALQRPPRKLCSQLRSGRSRLNGYNRCHNDFAAGTDRSHDALNQLATYDGLTRLPNRRGFREKLTVSEQFAKVQRHTDCLDDDRLD